MAKYVGYKRPKDTKKTLKHLFSYLGLHKWSFVCVAVLVFISAGANIAGTYLLKPVINHFIMPGDMSGLIKLLPEWGLCIFAAPHAHCYITVLW
jgi:ATP-binding cassette subfamily B multidrug efflux pump